MISFFRSNMLDTIPDIQETDENVSGAGQRKIALHPGMSRCCENRESHNTPVMAGKKKLK